MKKSASCSLISGRNREEVFRLEAKETVLEKIAVVVQKNGEMGEEMHNLRTTVAGHEQALKDGTLLREADLLNGAW